MSLKPYQKFLPENLLLPMWRYALSGFLKVISRFEIDQLFGPVVRFLDGKWPEKAKQTVKLDNLIPFFRMEKRLLYK